MAAGWTPRSVTPKPSAPEKTNTPPMLSCSCTIFAKSSSTRFASTTRDRRAKPNPGLPLRWVLVLTGEGGGGGLRVPSEAAERTRGRSRNQEVDCAPLNLHGQARYPRIGTPTLSGDTATGAASCRCRRLPNASAGRACEEAQDLVKRTRGMGNTPRSGIIKNMKTVQLVATRSYCMSKRVPNACLE